MSVVGFLYLHALICICERH